MTSITRPDWLKAFGDAIASGDREGALRALQSQATGHAGTAPAALALRHVTIKEQA